MADGERAAPPLATGRAQPDLPSRALAGPTPPSERIGSIDGLRGFALLGILVVNIQSFAMVGAAYMNPTAYGSLEGADGLVWWVTHLLFDSKFMALFSMLFGAGVVMMTERVEARGGSPAGVHYRRSLWLMAFGILHAHLLWFGDVLYLYGLCGLVLYFFRHRSPRTLILLGIPVLAVATATFVGAGLSMPGWSEGQMATALQQWQPGPEAIAREHAVYRSGWLGQMDMRVESALGMETLFTLVWGLWRAGGMMLIGMGLYKLGVFSARASTRTYLAMVAAGLALGLPVVLLGAVRHMEAGWAIEYSYFFGSQYNYWGSVPVSLGWVGAVMLFWRSGAVAWLRRSLAAVGRMALTMYLLQTVIATTIFYGHGIGLFGQVSRVGQAAVVVAIWAVQLALAPWWLARYRFGPMEWLWRTLTYMRRQPLRGAAAAGR